MARKTEKNGQFINKLQKFIKNYDLLHNYYSYDLLYFFVNGKFYDWKTHNNNIIINMPLRKDIDTSFYEGFDD